MPRDLATVENVGTEIRHRRVGTIGVIQGIYPPRYLGMQGTGGLTGGFTIYVPAENERFMLPFENIGQYEVIREGRQHFMEAQAARDAMKAAREAVGSKPGLGASDTNRGGHLEPLTHCMKCGRVVDDTWEDTQCPRCGVTYLGLTGR